jgi:transcription initiation factor TFIID subunit 6
LASVENDESLQQLVPYFVQFIAEKVTHAGKNVFVLQTMMELTNAITRNEKLYVDPYVTTLVAPMLTCLLGRHSPPGADTQQVAEHYKLRDYAASLLAHIAKKYAKSSRALKPRLARTCLKHFLDPRKSLDIHYGAISGLSAVGGPEVVRALIIPNLKAYDAVLAKGESESPEDTEMVKMALVKSIRSIEDEVSTLANGNGVGAQDLAARVEEMIGSIVGKAITRIGDHKLEKAILERKDLE